MNEMGIDDVEQTCKECGRTCNNRRSLGNHLAKSHPDVGGLRTYHLKHFRDGIVPQCGCGCGGHVEWSVTKYCYNKYITGHNDAGFRVKQPEFTQEQINKRNDAIRQAYSEKRVEISRKISQKVSIGLNKSEVSQHLSRVRKKLWEGKEYKSLQHVARVKSWQGEAGEVRREKVFTPEFGRKIGAANMARNSTYTSRVEEGFALHLKEIGIDVHRSVWFDFGDKKWNADVWIPSMKTIVEFDGVYWHGLDRGEDFYPDQIKGLTNDFLKNKIAQEKGLNLLRIRSDVDLSRINSYEDLEVVAHHVVKEGRVIKEGTFKLDETTPLITRESVIRMAFSDGGKEYLSKTILPIVKNFLEGHVSYWGWFYPPTGRDISEVLLSLHRVAQNMSMSIAGSEWLKSRVRSYWDVDGGPSKMFGSDKHLTSVLSYRLGLNDSKPYEYTLSNGEKVTCQETFPITLRDIRNGFVVQRNKVSWFKPSWAAHIYKRFCGEIEAPTVWDPSIGFSARLLGFSSVFDRGTYIGTDPCYHMCRDAANVSSEILESKPGLNFQIFQIGSEKWIPEPESLDLVFTSPPYFDIEKYYDEPGQCWRDYPDLSTWRDRYYVPTMKSALLGLKRGRKMVLNVTPKLRDVTLSCAVEAGFHLEDEFKFALGKDHFAREKGAQGKHELFMIFGKV